MPAHRVRANHVFGRCVDLVRDEVLDWVLLIVFVGFFLGDDQLHVSQLGDGKLLRPNVVGVIVDDAFGRVDALGKRIDADLVASVGNLPIAPERTDPILAVGFDVFGEFGAVSEPRIEEVGVPTDTYLFFKFGDDLAGEIVLRIVVFVIFVLLFVEAESERISGFVVGVEGVDDILTLNSVTFGVIVETTDAGGFVPGFLGNRVVKDDVAVL